MIQIAIISQEQARPYWNPEQRLRSIRILVAVAQEPCDHVVHVATCRRVFRQPLAVVDAEDLHTLVVLEVGQQLGRDEEVLCALRLAGNLHHGVVHHALGALVHTLRKA